MAFLPPANEVWGKVIFLHQFVILFTGVACVVTWGEGGMHGCSGGQHVWLLWGGMHGFFPGSMRGCSWGGGHAWLLWGGRCMVFSGGHAWFFSGGACLVLGGVHRIRRDTVNERAVRILLECILVILMYLRWTLLLEF